MFVIYLFTLFLNSEIMFFVVSVNLSSQGIIQIFHCFSIHSNEPIWLVLRATCILDWKSYWWEHDSERSFVNVGTYIGNDRNAHFWLVFPFKPQVTSKHWSGIEHYLPLYKWGNGVHIIFYNKRSETNGKYMSKHTLAHTLCYYTYCYYTFTHFYLDVSLKMKLLKEKSFL